MTTTGRERSCRVHKRMSTSRDLAFQLTGRQRCVAFGEGSANTCTRSAFCQLRLCLQFATSVTQTHLLCWPHQDPDGKSWARGATGIEHLGGNLSGHVPSQKPSFHPSVPIHSAQLLQATTKPSGSCNPCIDAREAHIQPEATKKGAHVMST